MKSPFSLKGEQWVQSSYKRNMDVAMTVAASPLAVPLGLTAMGLVRLLDGDDLIFRQTRYGDNGRSFIIRKITSMRESDDPDAHNGRKTTAIGRKIRPLAIDELPQLINVLEGSMSLVGPRARTESVRANMEAALERCTYDEWLNAVELSPAGGLSSFGIAIRGPALTERSYLAKARMDIEDFNNAGFRHDLSIIRGAAGVALRRLMSSAAGSPMTYAPDEARRSAGSVASEALQLAEHS